MDANKDARKDTKNPCRDKIVKEVKSRSDDEREDVRNLLLAISMFFFSNICFRI